MGLEEDLDTCRNFPELLSLSRSFACPVCKELLKGPVVLPCGHSYCSGCIRHNFDFKTSQNQGTACPVCRQPCDPTDLRPCLTLREAVHAFSKLPAAVALLLEATRKPDQPARQEADACTEESSQPENHSLPQQHPMRKRKAHDLHEQSVPQVAEHATAAIARRSSRVAAASAMRQAPAAKLPSTSSSSVEILSSSVDHSKASQSSSEDASDQDDKVECRSQRAGRAGQAGPATNQHRSTKDIFNGTGSKRAAPSSRSGAGPSTLPPGYVACPVCGMSTRSAFMNTHLDSCISRQNNQHDQQNQQQVERGQLSHARPSATRPPERTLSVPNGHQQRAVHDVAPAAPGAAPIFSNHQRAVPKTPVIEVPPKLVFNLISDKDLKKRMMALGLPMDGKKQDWAERYQAYRRFLQTKLDEGSRCTQAQLRANFLLHQRQQTEARRVVPRLDAGTPYSAAPSLPSSRPRPTATGHQFPELIEQARARMEAKSNSSMPDSRGLAPEDEKQLEPGTNPNQFDTKDGWDGKEHAEEEPPAAALLPVEASREVAEERQPEITSLAFASEDQHAAGVVLAEGEPHEEWRTDGYGDGAWPAAASPECSGDFICD